MSNLPSNLGTLEEVRQIDEAAITLYNAGDIRQECQISGRFYVFEPRSVTPIHSRKEPRWTRAMTRDRTKPPVVLEGGTQKIIADTILEALQDRGICRFLNDGLDDQRSGAAYARYIEWRCSRAREVQAHWLAVVDRATKSPGALPPRPKKAIMDEIAFLRDHADGATDRKPWISRIDGADFATRPELVTYLERNYPGQVQQSGVDPWIIQRDQVSGRVDLPEESFRSERPRAVPGQARPIPAQRPAVSDDLDPASLAAETPREVDMGDADIMDTRFLLAKARELKVKLTPGELEGLIDSDVMTIENVTAKLATAATEARSKARVSRS